MSPGCAAIDRVLANEEEGVPEVGALQRRPEIRVLVDGAAGARAAVRTGIVIWDVYFSSYTTIEQQRIAVLLHCLAAIAAIIVWIIHVYAAIWVRGSVRAMTQGYVTPGWAWRHHRKWLRALVASGSPGPTAARMRQGEVAPKAAWMGNPPGGVKPPEPILLPTPLRFSPDVRRAWRRWRIGHPMQRLAALHGAIYAAQAATDAPLRGLPPIDPGSIRP